MTEAQKKAAMKREYGGVYCQGCGEQLRPDEDLSKIEYVRSKRGSSRFFHTACMNKVWKRKICW